VDNLDIQGAIEKIGYNPKFTPRKLSAFDRISDAINQSAFLLGGDNEDQYAISRWISPKRTRSYPYSRVYDTLCVPCQRRVTIIPIIKDEGQQGDRDFLQYDTISLMTLLDVYVILGHYCDAKRSKNYRNKITSQKLDISSIASKLTELRNFSGSVIDWNQKLIGDYFDLAINALEVYRNIGKRLGVEMTSFETGVRKLHNTSNHPDGFRKSSRELAESAQEREKHTVQPAENTLVGKKGRITIDNYHGGKYFLTVDEVEIVESVLNLIEAKHSKNKALPKVNNIKDALIKMYLFSNLSKVRMGDRAYNSHAVLKLTSNVAKSHKELNSSELSVCDTLFEESMSNNFEIRMPHIENSDFIFGRLG